MTLFTESGLDGQYLPSPAERARTQAADYEASGGVKGGTLEGRPGGDPDLGGREIGQDSQEPVMRIVDGDRYVAWHPTAGRPKARPGTPIWLCTRGCGFRPAPASRSFKPREVTGGRSGTTGRSRTGSGGTFPNIDRVPAAATYRSWCWSLLRRTDAVLSLDVAIVALRQERAWTD
jgi:hypothetical protein